MKRLFEKKTKDLTESSNPHPFPSLSTYNFSNLPPLSVVRYLDNAYLPTIFKSLPNLPFDLVVLHCYGAPLPDHVAFLYELRRVVSLQESTLLLFHYGKTKASKKWRLSMRLMSYPFQGLVNKKVSMWGRADFCLPGCCKIDRPLEKQPSRFYRELLRGTKRLLEVFPKVAVLSRKATSLGIPTTIFISGSDEIQSLVERSSTALEEAAPYEQLQ